MDVTVKEIIYEFEDQHTGDVVQSVIVFYDPQDYIFIFLVVAGYRTSLYQTWMKAPYDEEGEVGTWERIGKPKELIWDCLNDIKRQWKKIAGEY